MSGKDEDQMDEKRAVTRHKAEHIIGRQTYAPVNNPIGEKIKPRAKSNSSATIDRYKK